MKDEYTVHGNIGILDWANGDRTIYYVDNNRNVFTVNEDRSLYYCGPLNGWTLVDWIKGAIELEQSLHPPKKVNYSIICK